MNIDRQLGFQLGDWGVYPDQGRLVGEKGELHLEPKVMEVLVYLAERQDQVVRRDDLIKDVWHGTFVGDEVLSRAISLLRTGLGNELLRQTTAFHEETLPAAVEHADLWMPDICYLTSGDNEKALNSIEAQLEHNHIYRRDLIYRYPMYDQIRDEPRFQAVVEERERRIAIQREKVAQMDAKQSPVPNG